MSKNNSEQLTVGTWGDKILVKDPNVIRISFQNINGFLAGEKGYKSGLIKNFMLENSVDIYGMSEMNTNWRIVGKKNTLEDLCRGWFENKKVVTAYNQYDRKCDKHQPGGTAIIARGEMALRNMGIGQDSRKLGRWSWIRLRGKDGITLRVVLVYFPTVKKEIGKKKVYMQQKAALLQLNSKLTVFQAFWKDFWESVDAWLADGDQLVIGGDWNVDVRKEKMQREFKKRRNLLLSHLLFTGLKVTGKNEWGSLIIKRFNYPIIGNITE